MFDLLEVKPVKMILGDQTKDGLDERGTVLGGDCRREITGTTPSADGDASHCAMVLSLLDELGDVGGFRGGKIEDGGVRGGKAKIWVSAKFTEIMDETYAKE